MKISNLTAASVVGRWICYRRERGWHNASLVRAYVQEAHPGEIVSLVTELHDSARAVYPLRPKACTHPLLLPLDELEIHAVVEPSADPPAPAQS